MCVQAKVAVSIYQRARIEFAPLDNAAATSPPAFFLLVFSLAPFRLSGGRARVHPRSYGFPLAPWLSLSLSLSPSDVAARAGSSRRGGRGNEALGCALLAASRGGQVTRRG